MKQNKEVKDIMLKTHYSIPLWKIQALKKLGEDYKIEFNMPPFDNSKEEGYYDIHEFKETKKWKTFLNKITELKVRYEYAFKKGDGKRIYMAVQIWEKRD